MLRALESLRKHCNFPFNEPLFYYLAYALWVTASVAGITYFSRDVMSLRFLYFAAVFLLLLHELFYSRWSRKSIACLILFGSIIILSYCTEAIAPSAASGSTGLVSFFMFLYCARDVPLKRLALLTAWLLAILFCITVILAESSIITNELSYRGDTPRYGLGFIGRTFPSYFILAIAAFYAIARQSEYSVAALIALLVANAWVFFQTNTRNGFLLTNIVVVLLLVFRHKQFQKSDGVWNVICLASFPTAFLVMAILTAAYSPDNSFLQAVDNIFSYRLNYANQAFSEWGTSLFGMRIPWSDLNYIVDCSYLRIILDDGILGFAIVLAIHVLASIYSVKSKNSLFVVLCIIYSVHFAFDPTMSTLYLNPIAFIGITEYFQAIETKSADKCKTFIRQSDSLIIKKGGRHF